MLFQSINQPVLLTYQLHQDCLENLLLKIRGRGGHRDYPTCQQFRAKFRNVQIDSLLDVSKYANCEEDMDKLLLRV